MDFTALSDFVNTMGFPIACVIAMWYMLNKEREAHKEETDKMIDALNNNTIVLEQIKIMIGGANGTGD